MYVLIENTYGCGHESQQKHKVKEPEVLDDDFWHDVVYPKTGDGHGKTCDCGSLYVATILKAKNPEFVGQTYEWGG